LSAGREVGSQPADDRSSDLTAGAGLVDRSDRLVGIRDSALPRTSERDADRLGKAFSPEIRRHLRDRARDLALVACVDRQGDEAEARMTDGEVVDGRARVRRPARLLRRGSLELPRDLGRDRARRELLPAPLAKRSSESVDLANRRRGHGYIEAGNS
jgi:hypothetical protein